MSKKRNIKARSQAIKPKPAHKPVQLISERLFGNGAPLLFTAIAGGKSPANGHMVPAPKEDNDWLMPVHEESMQVRDLTHALFDEYGQAVRAFTFAKYVAEKLNPPAEVQAFIDREDSEWSPEEMTKMGWAPTEELLRKVAALTVKMDKEERAVRRSPARLLSQEHLEAKIRQARDAVRTREIVPLVVAFFRKYDMCDPALTNAQIDEEAMKDAREIEDWAVRLIHSPVDGSKEALLGAMKKKVYGGTPLSPVEEGLLAANAELAGDVMKLVKRTGFGVPAPANRLYKDLIYALQAWDGYNAMSIRLNHLMTQKQEKSGMAQQLEQDIQQTRQEMMAEHDKCLTELRTMPAVIQRLCDTMCEMHIGESRDSRIVELSPDKLNRALGVAASLPSIAQQLTYDVDRLVKDSDKVPSADADRALAYNQALSIIMKRAVALGFENENLVKAVKELRQHPAGENRYDESRPEYRAMLSGLHGMKSGLGLMMLNAEKLYAEMSHITGKDERGWAAAYDEDKKTDASAPCGPELKVVAQRIQSLTVKLYDSGANKQRELQDCIDGMGSSDHFDLALDVFERLHANVKGLLARMSEREQAWQARCSAAQRLA